MPLFQRVRTAATRGRAGRLATFVDAGHILGSAIIRLEVREPDGDEPTDHRLLRRPRPPERRSCATRRSMPTRTTWSSNRPTAAASTSRPTRPSGMLAEAVRAIADAGGRPADPVVRDRAHAGGRVGAGPADRARRDPAAPAVPRLADGFARSDIYRRHPEFYDEETREAARDGRHAARLPGPDITRSSTSRRRSRRAPRPYMIVASNGMLTGGRVVSHLRNLIDDPKATILFVGYQGEGTLGAHLQAGAKTVKLDGAIRRGPLPRPLDQRLLRPRRRVRAARLARQLHGRPQGRAIRASRRRSSSSTAIRRPSSRSRRRSRRWASTSTSRTGGNASRCPDGRRCALASRSSMRS